MKLINGHTTLRTIRHDDMEQMRIWRNRECVSRYLVNRHYISVQQQEIWFQTLDYSASIYFMMEESSLAAGVIYAHNIDATTRSFEGSIFIGSGENVNIQLPVKACLMLTLFFFDYLNYENALSKVHRANTPALQMDRRMGFKEISREGEFIYSKCAKDTFRFFTEKMRQSLLYNQGVDVVWEEGDERFSFLLPVIERQGKN